MISKIDHFHIKIGNDVILHMMDRYQNFEDLNIDTNSFPVPVRETLKARKAVDENCSYA